MFNHLKLQGKCTYVTNIHHVFVKSRENVHISIFVAFCGREIWEISQLALILVAILVIHWQISRLQLKFQFLPPAVNQIYL